MIFSRGLIFALLHGAAMADECTDSCDASYTQGIPVTMCGTDFETHESHGEAFYDNKCYDLCGIMTYYEGACGCPHSCYSELGQGTCGGDQVCKCTAGWGGEDCSLPVGGNSCSYHGKIMSVGDAESKFPYDYCVCDRGFTGVDCSSAELAIPTNPWGNIFDVQTYYDDEYEDMHPVWNISVLATVRVQIEDADYLYLLDPENLYTEDYRPATIHFDNGHVQETFDNVGIHVKGQGGRMDHKKGWSMKFNKYVSGQKLLDIEKLNFKGCSEDDSFIKIQMATEMYKAMGSPSQRSSYALMYINNVFTGLYFMHENIDDHFIESRFPGSGDGNLMQMYYNVHLNYYGADDTYYREKVYVNDLDYPMHYYSRAEGLDDDWSDFISWLEFLATSSDEDFYEYIEQRVDVDNLLRFMAVEAFMLSSDNLASGNNMYIYHQTKDEIKNQMSIFTYDFESVFVFDRTTNEVTQEPDIFQFFLTLNTSFDNTNPMVNRLLASEKYKNLYVEYMSTFLSSLFGSDSPQQPGDRFSKIFQFVLPWASRDKLWQLSYDITIEQFVFASEQSIANLPLRYENVTTQINAYLDSM